jgi:RNA polymerase sigma-70 factor (ECF subfamily)
MDSRWIEIEALVLRAQTGDRDAFGDLVRRFERSVAAFARQRVRDQHEADELVQEVFLHAMRKIGQLRNAACFGAWLRRITVRVAINRGLRKQPVAVAETSVLESAARTAPEPIDDLVREEHRRRVRDAVAKLKPIDRDALSAFYLRGRSLLEIAAEEGVPVGTVKRRLHTARRRLQGSLEGIGAGMGATGSASASSSVKATACTGSASVKSAANGRKVSGGTGSASASKPSGFQSAEADQPRRMKRTREFALAE